MVQGRPTRKSPWFALVASVLGIGSEGCTRAAEPGAHRTAAAKSAILITIDTLRSDHLSSYGYARRTSPRLDGFIGRGTRFAQAFSTSSRTAPSHTAMLTGRYPLFTTVGVENGQFPLDSEVDTLAEVCRRAGLRTAAIVSNPVLDHSLGLDQGFESYDDQLPDRELNRTHREQTAEHAVAKALAKLNELKGQRFLLWVHFQDPHGPYTPPGEFASVFAKDGITSSRQEELPIGVDPSGHRAIPTYQVVANERRLSQYVDRYDGEIAYLDSQVARLFDELERLELMHDTLVALTSDHGEALGEDGFFCAHGQSLGLDQTSVPLAFVGAGARAGAVLSTPVTNLAIFATLLDALGLEPVQAAQPGASLWPSLTTGVEPRPAFCFGTSATQWAAFGRGRYLRRDRFRGDAPFWARGNPMTGAPYVPMGEQLVTLGGGAGGAASDEPPEALVREALADFVERSEQSWVRMLDARRPGAALTPQQTEQLRALGYLK